MKPNRFLLFATLVFLCVQTNAQVSAFINGKPIKPGATVAKKDLTSLEISFKNPKKVTIISGLSVLYVQLVDAKKSVIQQWSTSRDGYVAIDDFLKNTPAAKKFTVFGENGFNTNGNTLDWIFTSALGKEEQKTIQIKVGLYAVQETGYQKYGQPVQLLEPLTFNVPVWDAKNLYLPFLDLSIDKTAVQSSIETLQNGFIGKKDTRVGYELVDTNNFKYTVFAFKSEDYPGLNTKELADDFIHTAVKGANFGSIAKFRDYDLEKFNIPWEDVNDLTKKRYRLKRLNAKLNKDIKGKDLMSLYVPVEINGLKGYMLQSDSQSQTDTDSEWQDLGKFVIYILDHPTNPKLTLVASTFMFNDYKSPDQPDAFIKAFLNSIKR